jgi:uncharacterized spore protein YtfJ
MDIEALLAKASDNLTAGRSFGPVVERDGCTVIPVAAVLGGGGGGGGEGPPDGPHSGSGSGGGHFGVSWPVGAYVVRDGDVRWMPAVDVTRIAIAAVLVVKLAVKVRGARHQSVGR